MRIEAIIFDFDGLMLDTEQPDLQSWQEVFAQFGQRFPTDRWLQNIGSFGLFDPFGELEVLTGRPVDRDALRLWRRARNTELIDGQPLLPGVRDWIEDARQMGLPLGIATSSSAGWASGHVERLGLSHHFNVIRCRDDVVHAKPAPDLYLAAASALGVHPAHVLAIEDAPNGVLAAKRAGMRCVAVPSEVTAALNFAHADLVLESLAVMPLDEALHRLQAMHTEWVEAP